MSEQQEQPILTTSDYPSIEKIKRLVENKGFVIFTATWYDSKDDLRFKMCLKMIKECGTYKSPIVVVDGSPSEEVHSVLKSSGAIVYRQTGKGKKGAALREAAMIASQLPGVTDATPLCWQEPEKIDMVRHWGTMFDTSHFSAGSFMDVLVPWRNQRLFQETYPVEQYHSEMYGNHYLDTLAVKRLNELNLELPDVTFEVMSPKLPRIDWHFGPFSFRAEHVKLWTEYKGGDSYDAQLVPIVHAMRKGLNVCSRVVDFKAPLDMKKEEEGNVNFIEKRLAQLNDLDPKVKRSWMEEFYC